MKLYELQVDEGWKDWAMAAGVGAVTLGGGHAVHDAFKSKAPTPQEKQVVQQSQQRPAQATPVLQRKAKVTPASIAQSLYKQASTDLEKTLIAHASKAGIDNTELKQFLAQCAHETAGFTTLAEVGSNKYMMKRYDKKYAPVKAKILGNVHKGDGVKYKGRGYLQLTGRYNYALAGEALGLPLEDNPEMVEQPDVAAKVAIWYWNARVKPKVDDFSDVKASTKPINPGLGGLKNRTAHYDRYASIS